jgi:hypothetical protein
MTDHGAKPLIENSDRGITLNKSLAWTVGCGIVGAGLYIGLSLGGITTKLDEVSRGSTDASYERRQIETRVRSLEQSKARDDERFTSILAFMSKIDARLDRIENKAD